MAASKRKTSPAPDSRRSDEEDVSLPVHRDAAGAARLTGTGRHCERVSGPRTTRSAWRRRVESFVNELTYARCPADRDVTAEYRAEGSGNAPASGSLEDRKRAVAAEKSPVFTTTLTFPSTAANCACRRRCRWYPRRPAWQDRAVLRSSGRTRHGKTPLTRSMLPTTTSRTLPQPRRPRVPDDGRDLLHDAAA